MQLQDARAAYEEYTGIASNVSRHLAFAGIALIWILSGGGLTSKVDGFHIGGHYRVPLALLVVTLALDFVQYVYQAAAWHVFYRVNERKLWDDSTRTFAQEELTPPAAINRVAEVAFYTKVVLVAGGYMWLLVAASQQLF